jgi:sarcosine oxidase subunit beta
VFENFAEEFGVDPHFRQPGYLILAQTEDELALQMKNATLQRSLGVDVRGLTAEDVKRAYPYIRTDDVRGATYSPRDGYMDAYLVTTGIAMRARELGAVIKQQHEVTGFRCTDSRVTGVRTNRGEFEAPIVIVAAGPWAGLVGELAGVDVPVLPRRRSKFVMAPVRADKIPIEAPFIVDQHHAFSLHREGSLVVLGAGRKQESSTFNAAPDWELDQHITERAVHRVPSLDGAMITTAYAGLFEMTPDQTGIIGRVRDGDGLYMIGGFSGHGFMHGPIAGQLMAELVAEGRARTLDITPLSLERFAQGKASVEPMSFIGKS